MKISWKGVIRDVLIICILTFAGALVVRTSVGDLATRFKLFLLSNLFLQIVGFTIGGCIAKTRRIKHLFIVAIGVWIVNLLNIALGASTFTLWLVSLLPTLLMMLIGWALSFLFVRAPKTAQGTKGPDVVVAIPKENNTDGKIE